MKYRQWVVLLLCMVLLGCPPGHFHEYTFVGTPLPSESPAYTRLAFNDSTSLYVKTGYYNEFINDKAQGLSAVIKLPPQYDLGNDSVVVAVWSARFGVLQRSHKLPYTTRVYDTAHTLMYDLPFNKQPENINLKSIAGDTINMALTNGQLWQFVRAAGE